MKTELKKIILASLFLALGYVITIPFRGLMILNTPAGVIFSPMHITVLIAGLLLGARYGFSVGLLTPLLASLISSMPALVPTALIMALELATYGLVAGFLYKQRKVNIFISLVIAMLLGRIIYLFATGIFFLVGIVNEYTIFVYLKTLFIISSPAILIQIILVPLVVKAVEYRLPHLAKE